METEHKTYTNLITFMANRSITEKQIADLLLQDIKSVNMKINGESDFTLSEFSLICKEYHTYPSMLLHDNTSLI